MATKKATQQKPSDYIEDELDNEEPIEREEDTDDVEETQELEFGDESYGRIGDFGCSDEWD